MGLFKKSIPACEMCGKTEAEGCGSENKHVERISASGPTWLSAATRAQGVGQFTWRCTRCNAYPAMKWPSEGGAWAGMTMHLGKAHGAGKFGSSGIGLPVNFEMRPAQ
jgi:hypothetical protein